MNVLMKTRFLSLFIVIIFFSGLFFLTCGKGPDVINVSIHQEPQPRKPGDDKKTFDELIIYFSKSSAPLEHVGKEVKDGITISPSIDGVWHWESDHLLVFQPSVDWLLDKTYKVTLNKSLFPKHVILSKYTITFKTPEFYCSLKSYEYYIHPIHPDEKHIVAELYFPYTVDTEALPGKITIVTHKVSDKDTWYKNKKLDFNLSYNEYNNRAYIMSEVLPIPIEDVEVKLVVEKGIKAENKKAVSNAKIERTITIPGMTSYVKILSCKTQNIRSETYELEQVIVLETKGEARIEDIFSNLSVYLLPEDKPAQPGLKEIKNYSWNTVDVIDRTVLNLSQRISLEALPNEHDYVSLFSFRIEVPVNTYLYFRLNKNIPFYGGYILPQEFQTIMKVPPFPKEINILHDGTILSMSGEKKISIMSYNISKVRFEIGRLIKDQVNHLITQSNGDITNLRFRNWYFDEDNLVERSYKTLTLYNSDPRKPQYFSFDFTREIEKQTGDRNGIFFFRVTELNTNNWPTRLYDSRLIMITDLGILIKNSADAEHDVFVQHIASGKPASGARVQVIGKNGLPLVTKTTAGDGHVHFPSFASFKNEQEPVAYVVSRGKDLSFLPFRAYGRWLDFSNFDIGGVHGFYKEDQLDAYIFSERDLYRPGDTIYLGIIVRTKDWSKSLNNLPLELVITDSRGLEVHQERVRISSPGLTQTEYKTDYTSPTGTYKIHLYSIKNDKRSDVIGSKIIRVEEFLPDRLRLTTQFSEQPKQGWVRVEKLKAYARLSNLYGTPAADHKIRGEVSFSPAHFYFHNYRQYTFSDPFLSEKQYVEELGDKITDKNGHAEYDIDLAQFAGTTINVAFTAEGFEKHSGRSVFSSSSIIVSPLPYIIGTKSDSNLSYLYLHSEAYLDLIALDQDAKPTQAKNLKCLINAITWVSVLTKLQNGTYKYQSVKKMEKYAEHDISIPEKGLTFQLPTEEAGEYELILINTDGERLSTISFSIIGQENLVRSIEKNVELKIQLSKTDFDPGEDVEVFINAPYTGSGLITIEQDRVYAHKWFTTKTSSSIQHIRVPSSLEGNAYINVAFIRSIDSPQVYMSPLSYGVSPFSINRDKRTIKLTIDIPQESRPGKPFPIKYRASKKCKVILWAVDEGILQVARYKRPDPLSHFFKKRALEVKTAQILDLILPEFSVASSLAAIGGGIDLDALLKNLNPFKRKNKPPVVFWSGIIDAGTEVKQISYTVPDFFNGTLHVFALAVARDSIGVEDEKAIIKDYFVMSPNIPLFASPKDQISVSLVVANNIKGSGKQAKVTLTLSSSEHIMLKKSSFTFAIDEGRDAAVDIPITVSDVLGPAEIVFSVAHGEYSSSVSESLSIRPPVPYKTTLQTESIKKKAITLNTERILYPHYRTKEVALSSLPLGIAKGLLAYLDYYPYGCSEQIVSSTFPYVSLCGITEWNLDRNSARRKVAETIRILRYRQNSNGSFGTWAATTSGVSPFLNVYILHFLTEAKESGFNVPLYMIKRSTDYILSYIRSETQSVEDAIIKAYAIYMITRQEIVTSTLIETLTKEYKAYKRDWKKRLESLYIASSLHLMQDNREANSLLNSFKIIKKPLDKRNAFYTQYTTNAQYLYLVARHFPGELKNISESVLSSLVTCVENQMYNTITSSYIIMAFTEYLKVTGDITRGRFILTEILDKKKRRELTIPEGLFPVIPFSDDAKQIRIDNKEKRYLYYQIIEAGFDREIPAKKQSHKVEIVKEFVDTDGNVTTKATLGDFLEVRLKFRSLHNDSFENIVIVDCFPGGFEPVIDRKVITRFTPEYVDIREDRIICYGRCTRDMSEYVYWIKAVNPGEYIVPPAFIEHMYDHTIYGITPFEKNFIINSEHQ